MLPRPWAARHLSSRLRAEHPGTRFAPGHHVATLSNERAQGWDEEPAESANPAVEPAVASVDRLFADFLRRVSDRSRAPTLKDWVDLAEAWRITHALRECGGNRSAAARSLGIGRRTLYSKMEKLRIEPIFSSWGRDEAPPAF